MKIKTFGIVVLLTFLFQVPSHAAFNWFKKKSETAPTPAATVTQTAADEDQKEQSSPVVKKATAADKEPLTKEEQDEIFQEQKDMKDLKDSDKLAKEGVDGAILNRSLDSRATAQAAAQRGGRGTLTAKAPERPMQRPIVAAKPPLAPIRPVTNPNAGVIRAPERPQQTARPVAVARVERPVR